MVPTQHCVNQAVTELLRHQPTSLAKVRFAWDTAVGPHMARGCQALRQERGTLHVRAADRHWQREIERSKPIILARLGHLLGPDVVTRITVSARETVPAARPSRRSR